MHAADSTGTPQQTKNGEEDSPYKIAEEKPALCKPTEADIPSETQFSLLVI